MVGNSLLDATSVPVANSRWVARGAYHPPTGDCCSPVSKKRQKRTGRITKKAAVRSPVRGVASVLPFQLTFLNFSPDPEPSSNEKRTQQRRHVIAQQRQRYRRAHGRRVHRVP